MKLLIAAPLYPPELGGPANYAKELTDHLAAHGSEVVVEKFSDVRVYPKGVAHLVYFFRLSRALKNAQAVIAFDTWSTGVPAVLAARLRGARSVVRIGGDFLWEQYVERTHELVKLSEFYTLTRPFSLKERLIMRGTRWVTHTADALVFNTAWQKRLWEHAYRFPLQHASVIENAYPEKRDFAPAQGRVFVAVGRARVLKNMHRVSEVFEELTQRFPDITLDTRPLPPHDHEERLRRAYAVIVPSVSEVSSNTVIDALRYGKPVILSSDTGARERLGDAGIFIDPRYPDELRQAIEHLLDPAAYARACERVRAFSFTHSWDEVASEFFKIITTVCES